MGGRRPKVEKVETLTPDQRELLTSVTGEIKPRLGQAYERVLSSDISKDPMYQQAQETLGGLMKDYDPSSAREYYQQAVFEPSMQQFQERVLPAVQERFAGHNAQRSSALNQALGQAAQGFGRESQGRLAELLYRGEQDNLARRQQAINQALGMSLIPFQERQAQLGSLLGGVGTGLGTRAFETVMTPGRAGPMGAIGTIAGGALGGLLGGTSGAGVGASIGGAAGSLF